MKQEKKLYLLGEACYQIKRQEHPYEFIILPQRINVISEKAFKDQKINKLFIPNSIEYIGAHSIENTGLKELYFEENSNMIKINYAAFSHNNLKEVHLPESIQDISEQVFYGNKELKLHIKNLFTHGILRCGASHIYYKEEEITSIKQLHQLQNMYILKKIEEGIISKEDFDKVINISRSRGIYTKEIKNQKTYILKRL